MKWLRLLFWAALTVMLVIGGFFAFRTQPIAVDLIDVTQGILEVTVNEDGKTRIMEKYIISTPVGGRLRRIVLREGDTVSCTHTIVASIQPSNPVLLDARAFAEARARVSVAEAAVERASTRFEQAKIELERAESEYNRNKKLRDSNTVSVKEFELVQAAFNSSLHAKRSSEFEQDIANYELQMAQAALLHVQPDEDVSSVETAIDNFEILAPIDGVILRVFLESSTVVSPGTPILEVGDPQDLEVVVDVLSTDAVKIQPGATVYLEQWGDDEVLQGVVRLIEPSAFEKTSALGVDEQRVNVIIDFKDDSNRATTLGDGYRMEARIVIWHGDNVIRVPTAALFREKNKWAVFKHSNGRAELVYVMIGRRNSEYAEVLNGLQATDQVILHPSDKLSDNAIIVRRESK